MGGLSLRPRSGIGHAGNRMGAKGFSIETQRRHQGAFALREEQLEQLAHTALTNKHILVVEDEWDAGAEIAHAFERRGATVVGPVPTVARAMQALAQEPEIDGAVLDISLGGEMSYPVADALIARGIPFLFATGYSRAAVPSAYRGISICIKPFEPDDVILAWAALERQALHTRRSGLCQNRLASRLDPNSFSALAGALRHVRLPARVSLSTDPVGTPCCYFLSEGLASCMMTNRQREGVEVGVIGPEGVTGLSALWREQPSLTRPTMLVAGSGWRISAKTLRHLCATTPSVERLLREFAEAFLAQVSLNLLAAARYRVDQRVARWLSLASDRIGNPIPISHDTIAMLLGVRRAGVTLALTHLRDLGAVAYGRREIVIVSREMLTCACGGCYGPADMLLLNT